MKKIMILSVLVWHCLSSIAQTNGGNTTAFPVNFLEVLLYDKRINVKTYLDSTGKIVMNSFMTGRYSSGEELLRYLQLYKELAWSDSEYKVYRLDYYSMLANNARMQNRNGEALYYCEKLDKESGLQKAKKYPLYAFSQACYLHNENKSHLKTITLYEKEADNLKRMPQLLESGAVAPSEAIVVLTALSPIASSYALKGDTILTNEVIALADDIVQQLFKRIKPTSENGTIARFLTEGMKYAKYVHLLKDYAGVGNSLNEVKVIIYDSSELSAGWRAMLEENYELYRIDYLLTTGQNDSAAFYIEMLSKKPTIAFESGMKVKIFKARLMISLGRPDAAFPLMEQVLEDKDSITTGIMEDMDGLLYAHTQAENNRAELKIVEREKQYRNVAIIAGALFSVIIFFYIYRRNSRKNRIAQEQLSKLNSMTTMLIAEMEMVRSGERKEEQKRIGRELHDNLSATVASLKYQLETIEKNNDIPQLKNVTIQVNNIYETIRDKSHQLALQNDVDIVNSFESRIITLIDHTLPGPGYMKKIVIDDMALYNLNIDDKISILRIIQEAVINILKHAKATEIEILLYQGDHSKVVLLIKDNGRGFESSIWNEKKLGLQSIKERARQLGGTLTIDATKSGTSLLVEIIK